MLDRRRFCCCAVAIVLFALCGCPLFALAPHKDATSTSADLPANAPVPSLPPLFIIRQIGGDL